MSNNESERHVEAMRRFQILTDEQTKLDDLNEHIRKMKEEAKKQTAKRDEARDDWDDIVRGKWNIE